MHKSSRGRGGGHSHGQELNRNYEVKQYRRASDSDFKLMHSLLAGLVVNLTDTNCLCEAAKHS